MRFKAKSAYYVIYLDMSSLNPGFWSLGKADFHIVLLPLAPQQFGFADELMFDFIINELMFDLIINFNVLKRNLFLLQC